MPGIPSLDSQGARFRWSFFGLRWGLASSAEQDPILAQTLALASHFSESFLAHGVAPPLILIEVLK
eukprot:1115660-Karenia_brevis.AAC.1